MLMWLIVELEKQDGGRRRVYKLVNERSLVAGAGNVELHTGKAVSLRRGNGFKSQKAHIVMVSEDRRFLEEQIKIMEQQPISRAAPTADAVQNDSIEGSCADRQPEIVVAAGKAGSEEASLEGDYSHSASDWDPDTQSSTDSEQETKRKCVPKREYNHKILPKARGPSLRAELPGMRNSPALRSYSRISMENQRMPNDNQRISIDHQRMPIDNQRVSVEHQRVPIDNQRISIDHQRMPIDNQRISMDHQRMPIDNQRISIDHQRMPIDNQRISIDHQRISMDHQRMSIDHQRIPMDNQRMAVDNQRIPMDNQRMAIEQKPQYQFNVPMSMTNSQMYDSATNFPKTIMTFDQQSQTENTGGEDIYALSGTIAVLQGEVSRLTQMLTEMQEKMECMRNALGLQYDPFDSNYSVREEEVVSETNQRGNPILMDNNMAMSDAPVMKTPARRNVLLEVNRGPHGQNKRISRQYKREPSRENTSNSYGSDDAVYLDMVPIGSGKTFIPKGIYSHIDWNSYTIATRKLLMAVFPRRTLATHSLTGKASPAFMSKPAKLRLDMKKVSDIVLTVVENCGVRESLVRSCITTKCADENKMYRMRLLKKANKSKKNTEDPAVNQENTPPGRNYEANV